MLKSDEAGIVGQVVHADPARFDGAGMLIAPPALPPVTAVEEAYIARYVRHFGADALAVEAAHLMEEFKISSLVVVDAGRKVVGALNIHDLLRARVV